MRQKPLLSLTEPDFWDIPIIQEITLRHKDSIS